MTLPTANRKTATRTNTGTRTTTKIATTRTRIVFRGLGHNVSQMTIMTMQAALMTIIIKTTRRQLK